MRKSYKIILALLLVVGIRVSAQGNSPLKLLHTTPLPGFKGDLDHSAVRCGTANVFCAVEPKAGRHFTFPTPDRSAPELAQVLFHLALQYPEAETIHRLPMRHSNNCSRSAVTLKVGRRAGQTACPIKP